MWADAFSSDENISAPSTVELQQAFERMGQNLTQSRKFCIFVDGLDEYSGRPIDGVNSILELAKNSNMKIIVSSRPIQPCVQAFSKMPKLYLQDLTAGDIRTYIEQTIDSHPHMGLLRHKDPHLTNDLRSNLIEKANGVFLWVVLACRSFREGLDNYDRLSDLRERIDELPPELERLFQHMLSNIEDRYQDHATKILRICHQNQLMSDTQRLYTLGLALVDDYDLEVGNLLSTRSLAANEIFATPLDRQRKNDEKYTQCMILEGRLRSHCFGLVEIKKARSKFDQNCFCGYRSGSTDVHDEIIDSTVEFMHRTVFDFLSARGTAESEYRMKDQEIFDPSIVLSCISLHLVGLRLHSLTGALHVQDTLVHTANTGIGRRSQVELILTRLQELVVGRSISGVNTLGSINFFGKVDQQGMADIKACEFHLALFLAIELGITGLPQMFECMGRGMLSDLSLHIPLLCRAFEHRLTKNIPRRLLTKAEYDERDVEMVRYLIARGCNPNEQFLDSKGIETTPWKELLWFSLCKKGSIGSERWNALMIDIYMEGGADLDLGTMLCTEAQKAAEVDGSLKRTHRLKGTLLGQVTKMETSPDICNKILQKIARYKEKLSTEAISPLTQEEGRNLEKYSTYKQRIVPQLRTSWKRVRSLSPPRFDRRIIYKTDTGELWHNLRNRSV